MGVLLGGEVKGWMGGWVDGWMGRGGPVCPPWRGNGGGEEFWILDFGFFPFRFSFFKYVGADLCVRPGGEMEAVRNFGFWILASPPGRPVLFV